MRALGLALAAWSLMNGPGAAETTLAAAEAVQSEPGQVLLLIRTPAAHARPGGFSGGYGDEGGQQARRRQARRLAEANGLELVDGWPMPLLGVDCFLLRVVDGRPAADAAARLAQAPGVAGAQVSNVYQAQGGARARDPLYPAQPAARAWNLNGLHRFATGKGVRVAVIDSMVDRNHPDLAGQVSAVRNFAPVAAPAAEDHGTGVAGVIAARADNGVGIVGVAPKAEILGLRACWQTNKAAGTVCDTYSLAQAIHFAIDQKVAVINLSLAGPPDPVLAQLIDVAISRGIRVVAAYDPARPGGGFPASHAGVIAVAEDEGGARPTPAVFAAPGKGVPTTAPGGRWQIEEGSSFAAAHVSGLLALSRQRQGAGARSARIVAAPLTGEIDACATLLQGSSGDRSACASSP